MTKKIKHIIFDVGNVLFKYDPNYIINELLPNTPHKDFYLEHLFNSPYWQHMDRGDMSTDNVIHQLQKKHDISNEIEKDLRLLINEFAKHLILDEKMKALFLTACKKYNLYIL